MKKGKKAKCNKFRSFSKFNMLRYISLFVASGSIKKAFLNWLCQSLSFFNIFSIDFAQWKSTKSFSQLIVSIYLFSGCFSIDFAQWNSSGLPHNAYTVIH